MERREWSRADLARKGELTTAQVTRVLNRQQNAGDSFMEGIAKAFGIGIENVYRAAGKIPASKVKSPALRDIEIMLADAEYEGDEEGLEIIRDIIRSVKETRQEKKKRTQEAQSRNGKAKPIQRHP